MYLGTWAERHPNKAAVMFEEDNVVLTYAELEQSSNQVAHLLRDDLGLEPGDGIAVMLENQPEFAPIWWAAMRSGLYITPINWHLAPGEIEYVLADSGARALFYGDSFAEVADRARRTGAGGRGIVIGGASRGHDLSFAEATGAQPSTRLDRELAGASMFYSSGTTGQPKGIRSPLPGKPPADYETIGATVTRTYGIDEHDRYLSPGPLYHSSPAIWSFGMHTVGATAVIMRRFDPESALRAIEQQRITVSQWVPTMFNRMLSLPDDVRQRYDLSSHRVAYHAAAPCSIKVKRQMIDWWGPIVEEFYAGTEAGSTHITSKEWLEHPGSVGRHWTGKPIYILDPITKAELPVRQEGLIYFEAMSNHRFEYRNAPEKTENTYLGDLVTLGDIGFLDDDGYLYLTDRQSHMIICGGVNIYPREVEEVLAGDPRVEDVAVIGVPNADMGEEVKGVVTLQPGVERTEQLEGELIALCRERLASIKCPRSIDIVESLPRDDNGKLYKRRLRDDYWKGRASRLV
jgi:fatty-acyl-CoA synthase